MSSRAVRWALLVAAIGFWNIEPLQAGAEGSDPAALAAALKDAAATLQGGLRASEREGTPISAKFEIDAVLQLRIDTNRPGTRIGVDRGLGGDQQGHFRLSHRGFLRRRLPEIVGVLDLLGLGDRAGLGIGYDFHEVTALHGINRQLQLAVSASAKVTLLQGTTFKTVTEKLD
jgi:hypothetical protein